MDKEIQSFQFIFTGQQYIRITPTRLESFRLERRRGLTSSRTIQPYFPDCYSFRKERVAVAFFDDTLLSENAQNICFSGLISHIASLCLFQTSAHLFFSSSLCSFPALFRSFYALFLLVILLIVSANALILSADILIVLADAIRKSTLRKGMLIAPALSCAILWHSWEGKVRIFFTCFSPRMVAKEANEYESGWAIGQVRLVGRVGRGRLVRESKPSTPPHGGDGGGSSLSPPANFKTSSAFIVNRAL